MLGIEQAEHTEGFNISLLFSNGMQGTANLETTILDDERPVFSALKDQSVFRNFKVAHSTLTWPGDLDLAPEYLFYLAFKDESEFQGQFKKWGYLS